MKPPMVKSFTHRVEDRVLDKAERYHTVNRLC
jgi:hypothetical protein